MVWNKDNRKKYFITIGLVCCHLLLFGQTVNGWDTFKKVKFKPKYFADFATNILIPSFKPEIKALEGKEITLTGYVIPVAESGWSSKSIVLSKVPYSSCFFCGGAGPDTVAELEMGDRPPRFKMDRRYTFKGILSLNDADINRFSFILKNVVMVE
jgi:hypothetical protein